MIEIRYDEIKKNDVIRFYGANLKVVEIRETPAPANEFYPDEKTIYFTVEPADEKAIDLLGNFYSHGSYGGVGCLKVGLVERLK